MNIAPTIPLLLDSHDSIAPKDMEAVEHTIGTSLPDDYRAFLLRTNGGEFQHDETVPISDAKGLGLDRIGVERLSGINTGESYSDLLAGYRALRDRVGADMLPIGEAPMGDRIFIALHGPARGKVYFWVHDDPSENERESLYLLADSFTDFAGSIEARLDEDDLQEQLPLFQLVESGNIDALRRAVEAGDSVDITNADGETLLMCAVANRWPLIVKFLIDQGSSVECADARGRTALFFASNCGTLDSARLLLNSGANINARSADGDTSLISAIRAQHLRVAKLLATRGADVTIQTKNGDTAASLCKNKELLAILENAKSD